MHINGVRPFCPVVVRRCHHCFFLDSNYHIYIDSIPRLLCLFYFFVFSVFPLLFPLSFRSLVLLLVSSRHRPWFYSSLHFRCIYFLPHFLTRSSPVHSSGLFLLLVRSFLSHSLQPLYFQPQKINIDTYPSLD
ncbi:hypothetical protein K457DRAFT_538294 [Linnemannia elongata AG-77]|uniref:Uncharacterized protein n=1 Tax=Linnemannia elongata AG-77 TaxID=1314771 RepID=A0A197JUF4_9FUNG|nr:hypothetical protein K457DRAFT_538294 [Linnemannia elongata AG-77]